jgi:MEDS: MEthanogen/methylotroph, DcmR Sensory domain
MAKRDEPNRRALMTTAIKVHRAYRHEALMYRGPEGFVAAVEPFVREGIDLGQPVMVAVIEPRIALLRAALGPRADWVTFVDMAELGANPARIIPAWREFVEVHAAQGTPIRGVGEPVWAGRRNAEVLECQLHEALLNLAVAPDTPFWLVCPYDVDALEPAVIDEAHRSHPAIIDDDYRGSTSYGGAYHAGTMFGQGLPEPCGPFEYRVLTEGNSHDLGGWVFRHAAAAGLPVERAHRLSTAVQEISRGGLRDSEGDGLVRLWREDSSLVCEVKDRSVVADPMVGRRPPRYEGRRGRSIRRANELCDLVQIRSTSDGTAVRVHTWL